MLDSRLNENGIYNKNILSEALDVEKKLDSAVRSLNRLTENKYTIASPRYSDMSRGGTFENPSNYELVKEKETEIILLEKSCPQQRTMSRIVLQIYRYLMTKRICLESALSIYSQRSKPLLYVI